MPESRGKQLADLTGVVPLQLTDDLRSAFEDYVSSAITKFGVPGAAVEVIQGERGWLSPRLRGQGARRHPTGHGGLHGWYRQAAADADGSGQPDWARADIIFEPAGSTGNCRRGGRVPGNARQAALIRLFGLDFTADQGTPSPRSGPLLGTPPQAG